MRSRSSATVTAVVGVLIVLEGCSRLELPPPPSDLESMSPHVRASYAERRRAVEALGWRATQQSRAEAWGELGQWYHARRMLEAADGLYLSAAGATRGVDRWDYLAGMVAQEQGATEAAVERLTAAARADIPGSQLRLAEVLFAAGELSDSWQLIEPLVAPIETCDDAAALYLASRVLDQQGDRHAAATHLRRAREIDPLSTVLLRAQEALGSQAGAPQVTRGSTAPRRNDPLAREIAALRYELRGAEQRARWLRDRGDPLAAAQSLLSDRELLGDDAGLEVSAANRLLEAGRVAEASELLEQAASTREDALTLTLLGTVRLRRGDRDGAIRAWEEAIEINPNYGRALLRLAFERRREGRADEAIDLAARASAALPAEPGPRILELVARLDRDPPEQVAPIAMRALTAFPEDPTLLHLTARLGVSTREPGRAREQAERSLERAPTVAAADSLAFVLAASGDFAAAATLAESVLRATREPVPWLEQRATSYARRELPPAWIEGERLLASSVELPSRH